MFITIQNHSEREVYKEEVRSLELVKLKLNERIRLLDQELKELRERNNELNEKLEEDEDPEVS